MGIDVLGAILDKISFGDNGMIGVDIGATMIKMAELDKVSGGNFKLSKYTSVPLAEGAILDNEIQNEDEVLRALRLGFKQLKSGRRNVCIGLSGASTAIKRLQLPDGLSPEERQEQAQWDVEQYLPFPIEDGNISYSVVRESPGALVDVVVGAAKKDIVNTYKTLVEKANVKVKIVDLSAAAILNVFELTFSEQLSVKGDNWLLLEIGAVKSQFIIYKSGFLTFSKEIMIGGNTITEEIQREMSVTFQEAESLKIQGDGNGNIPEEILAIIKQVNETFLEEITATQDFWLNASGEHELAGCAVTGGGALLPGINDQLAETLATEIIALNPFSKIAYNKNNITESMMNEIAYRGVCALGLGMRSWTP
jgi:type IV pilus assembly protein PilM